MAIPSSVREIFNVLGNLDREKDEAKIAFSVAGAIFVASWKSGMFKETGALDDTLFFKFSSCIDPKLRPNMTLLRLSGVFLNFAKDKIKSKVSSQALQRLLEAIDKVFRSDSKEQIDVLMRSLLHVRNASYVYVVYSSELAKKYNLRKEEGTKEDLDILISKQENTSGGRLK